MSTQGKKYEEVIESLRKLSREINRLERELKEISDSRANIVK